MTFDQCVNALITIAKSGVSEDRAIDQTDNVLAEHLASYPFDKVIERGRLAEALGNNAPDRSLTLIPLIQARLVGIPYK